MPRLRLWLGNGLVAVWYGVMLAGILDTLFPVIADIAFAALMLLVASWHDLALLVLGTIIWCC